MKKWLCVLLTLCMVLTLAACGEKTPTSGDNKGDATAENVEVELTKPITITFWHGIVQENMQKTLYEIVDTFNNGIGKEMGITVDCQAKGEMGDLENAVTAAIKAGNMPNVTMSEAASVTDWLQSGSVVDLTPYIKNANHGLNLDDYYDIYIEDSSSYPVAGFYSLPLYVACEVMYYNVDFFNANGLSVPTTWTEFEETAAKIAEITGKPRRRLGRGREVLLHPDGAEGHRLHHPGWQAALCRQAGRGCGCHFLVPEHGGAWHHPCSRRGLLLLRPLRQSAGANVHQLRQRGRVHQHEDSRERSLRVVLRSHSSV